VISGGKKTFLCPECAKAWKEQAKAMGELPSTPAAALPPQAAKPAEHAKPAAAKPAAAKPAPAEKKSEPPPDEHSAPLEFTPEPKKPEGTS